MSLGLLDDDNPRNDPFIPPVTNPDTGHSSAATAAAVYSDEDTVDERAEAAFDGLPNGYVAGAKPVAAPFELAESNGGAPTPNGRALSADTRRQWRCVATSVRNGLHVIVVLAVTAAAPDDIERVLQVPARRLDAGRRSPPPRSRALRRGRRF